MKIVTLTDEEEKLVAKLRRDALRAKSGEQSAEVVRAAGTSEGAKKGWEHRVQVSGDADYHSFLTLGSKNPEKHGKGVQLHTEAAELNEREAHEGHKDNKGYYLQKAKHHREFASLHSKAITKATDATSYDVIHCRASSAMGPQLGASQPWNPGERVEFMWMPAGVSTICAGFRKGSIELTVQCDEATAAAVQASLDGWREERPKQEPFGCIEHKEQEASFRVGASCGFKWNGDGVYLAAEPTTLGAQNVNGRVHRSWSPSFTTDADYARASEQPPKSGVLVFPEGVRGSRSNPARITGVDFCVGTLTNKPAFHSMSPVKAKEADAVTAAGTSEGAKKGWEQRGKFKNMFGNEIDAPEPKFAVGSKVHFHPQGQPEKYEADSTYHAVVTEHTPRDPLFGKHGYKVKYAQHDHDTFYTESELRQVKATDASSPYAVTAAGTSEGVRKSWEARKQHAIGLSDKAYSATVATQGNHSYESHSAALKAHMDAGDAHSEAAGDAAKEGAMSYSSGHAKKADYHYGMADSHERHAARYVPAKATDATASAAVTAHCAAQLVQDVPDATEAETAAYEAAMDKGSGHAQAVQELRAARVAKLSASEPPTADSIAAAYEAAVATANRIAAEQGAAKLTAEDVYKQVAPEPIKAEKQAATAEEILEQIYARAGANR